jgi:DNA invertase Pin-like site-specific DNA recombinase
MRWVMITEHRARLARTGPRSHSRLLCLCGAGRIPGDILIMTKLDRLGRDAIDVSSTVRTLAEMGVRVC